MISLLAISSGLLAALNASPLPQQGEFFPDYEAAGLQDQVAVEAVARPVVEAELPRGGRDFGDIAHILAVAGTGPKAVDPSGSYSGRRKRQVEGLEANLEAGDEQTREEQQAEQEPRQGRDFGDVARILAIAGTEPKAVDFSGSYTGRKKRQSVDQDEFGDYAVVETENQDSEVQEPRQGRDFGDIAKILAIAGTEPKAVDFSGSYSGKRKRRDSNLDTLSATGGFVDSVKLKSVKIKSYGKQGNLVHPAGEGVTLSRTVFDESFN